jgi:hypothetical protein
MVKIGGFIRIARAIFYAWNAICFVIIGYRRRKIADWSTLMEIPFAI